MKKLSLPWNPRGRIGRGAYLGAGIVLFATKFAIDYAIAGGVFGRHWSLVEYLAPGQAILSLLNDRADRIFYLTMSGIALPYILVGLSLTVQRLRDAGLPMLLVALFFLPLGNVFFFLALCLLESKPEGAADPGRNSPNEGEADPARTAVVPLDYSREMDPSLFPKVPVLHHWPQDRGASAALAVLLPAPAMVLAVMVSTHVLRDYGWGLFIGLPFVNGMLSAVLHGTRVPRTLGQSLGVGAMGVIASAAAILIFAIEGLGCMVMFLPLALPVGLFGAMLGHSIQARPMPRGRTWRVGCSVLGLLPLLMSAEHAAMPPAPQFMVTTVVEIDAPPEVVWRHVISFSDIPEPRDWLFKTGVAYPMRARISGSGPGAIRYCEFSTGAFVEPIEIWDEPRLLKFAVTQNPPPMKEWTLWANVHPPHLDNFLVSNAGQFRLIPLPGGRTRLEGTTWYRHHMWPAAYWQLWSDFIIHRIHTRVLNHVKNLS
jgi:uncharacterized membrane protein YhaH (DUF805 family)